MNTLERGVRATQETRSRTQDLANRAAEWLTDNDISAGGGAAKVGFVFKGSSHLKWRSPGQKTPRLG